MESDEFDNYLQISGIQHFSFCRRQWALIHIEQQWTENVLTVEGELLHARTHDDSVSQVINKIISVRGMRIKSDKLKITGCCDVVEFIPAYDGITLKGKTGMWQVRPVEYKHGEPKINNCDRLQATAQAICLEEMMCCKINEAAIFYAGIKKREMIEITDDLRKELSVMVAEMQRYYDAGYTPSVKPSKKCNNCSLSNICMPKLLKKNNAGNIKQYIISHISESE